MTDKPKTLLEQFRDKLSATMKAKGLEGDALAQNNLHKGVFRILIAEAERLPKADDNAVMAIIKKMIVNNNETITHAAKRPDLIVSLSAENALLATLHPCLLTGDALAQEVKALEAQVKDAKSDGQAVGLASKAIKATGKDFFGEEVKDLVQLIRSQK